MSALALAALTGGGAAFGASPTQNQLYNGLIPDDVIAASSAPGHHWTPGPVQYGVGQQIDLPLVMSDGVELRLNVFYPTNADGSAATGPFPVLLTQTPYGKGNSAQGVSSATGGADSYLIERGYIDVVADVRGTGDSGGNFGLFDPVQTSDGVALVKYAANLPHSNHKVGLYGPSYLGINQLFTAGAVGKNSPLKAIFPLVASSSIYRDTSFMGGVVDAEFDSAYLGGLTAALNALNPVVEGPNNPNAATIIAQHIANIATYNETFIAQTEAGGPTIYDGDYWKARQPQSVLAKVVANGIPAYLVGGEYDIFQRGEPQNYAALQNAYAGRSVTAPMLAGQAVTGRYQLIDGPFTHLIGSAPMIDSLELEWFDTWLKGADTGMATTPTPLHYFDIGTNTYAETTTFPFTTTSPTRLYFAPGRTGTVTSTNDGLLTSAAPTATTSGTDPMVWLPAASPCGRSVDQWSIGVYSTVTQSAMVTSAPCTSDDQTSGTTPSALTYTSGAFPSARTMAGPISATIYATSTTAESEWVAEIEDVAPDGTAKPLTEGALLGSLRAIDASQSWRAPNGQYLLPYHPYTQASQQAVVPGAVTRYDIEIFPTYSTIVAGHRLRITLSSNDAPHLAPIPAQVAQLTGGVYQVQRTPAGPSSVEIPFLKAAAGTS